MSSGWDNRLAMSKEAFDALAEKIAQHDREEIRAAYRAGKFPRADLTKDVDKRYRWDLFWATGVYGHDLYVDLLDYQIDTALRRIVPPL